MILFVLLSFNSCLLIKSKLIYNYSAEIENNLEKSATDLFKAYGPEYPKRNIFIYASNGQGDNRLTITVFKRLPECIEKLIVSSNRYVKLGKLGYVPIVFDHDHRTILFEKCGISMIPHGGKTIVFDDDMKIIFKE